MVYIPNEYLTEKLKQMGLKLKDYMQIYRCRKCEPKFRLNWSAITKVIDLEKDIDFVEKYKRKMDWDTLLCYRELSREFIERFADFIGWDVVLAYQKVPEDLLEKYKDKIDWFLVSTYQELSEPFIEKYQDKLDWGLISKNQKLTPNFVAKFIDRITDYVFDNPTYKSLPDPIKLLLKTKFNR